MKEAKIHLPVLVDEVVKYLVWNKNGVYIDATVGCGGHVLAILQNSRAFVIGFDLDRKQIEVASKRLSEFGERSMLIFGNYRDMEWFCEEKVDGVLFDFGLSSYQLDSPRRGFSYRQDGPLDMRYGEKGLTAVELIQKCSEEEIIDVLYRYGEEKFGKSIGKKIKRELPETTGELALLVRKTVPRTRAHKHLAKVFQALRIAVNDEFKNIEEGIVVASKLLRENGRLVTITYHREEEKLVLKKAKEEKLKPLVKKPVKPSKIEFENNPRCRSAHLRVFEK
jgi:16S rRNA (cytosine1402-N4)-methyltransferase